MDSEDQPRVSQAWALAIGMALISLEGEWVKVNQSVCDLLEYSKSDLMKLNFQQITHLDDLAKDLASIDLKTTISLAW